MNKDKKKDKQNKPQEKQWFDIKMEALVPTTMMYRVFAIDENEALKQLPNTRPTGIKPYFNLKRLIKTTVYNSGSAVVKLVKNFV